MTRGVSKSFRTRNQETHIIIGEGRSEKIYIDRIRSDFSNIHIHTIDARGGDVAQIKRCLNREMASYRKGDEICVVMDVDYKNVDDIVKFEKWCVDNGIELYISNPSFEVYLLMHYRDVHGNLSQSDLEESLSTHLGRKYDKGRGISLDEQKILSAVSRADRNLPEKQSSAMYVAGKPGTTTVHRLVKKLANKLEFG